MPQSQPRPLHKVAKPVKGAFLGSVRNRDYYLSDDLDHIWVVRAWAGHKAISESGVSVVLLTLLSWGENDMVNRIKAARMMLK